MQILKKSGKLEEFRIEKIETSIRNTSDDVGEHLSDKDVSNIAVDVLRGLERLRGKDGLPSVLEVRVLTGHAIMDYGYKKIAERYIEGCLE